LLNLLLGDEGETIAVDRSASEAFLRSILNKHHSTSILDLNYSVRNAVEMNGTVGVSYYKDEQQEKDKNVFDRDWKGENPSWRA